MNLRISSKIAVALSIMVVMMMVLGVSSYINSRNSHNNVKDIETGYNCAVLVYQIENELTGAALDMRRFNASHKEQDQKSFEQRMGTAIELGNQLSQIAQAENKPEIEKLIEGLNRYRDIVVNKAIPLEKATVTTTGAQRDEILQKLNVQVQEITVLTQTNQQFVRSIVNKEAKFVVQEVNQAESNSAIASKISLILMVLAVIIGIVLSRVLRRTITTPVTALVEELNKMAAGDLKSRDNQVLHRADEFGEISIALQRTKNIVRDLVHTAQSQSEQLSAASEELNASADQSAQAANQVAVSITEVANGAEKQVNAVKSTEIIVDQISEGIKDVAVSANSVAGKSHQTAEVAKDGEKSIESAVNQMMSIDKTVSNSAQVVAKLGERSKEIGQIVDAISGIAGQTNLLALNAAIEAARAGEQGRGFAVVAEEVRKLAEQSQEAAKQIATLINEIQVDTDQAVVAMGEGTREVKIGSEVINTAGRTFTEIVELVEQVSTQVKDIAAAIQNMASGSQQIVYSVRDINRLSNAAADEAQTVSAATEEASASMEEIASSSQSLTRMAQELQEAVSKFRV